MPEQTQHDMLLENTPLGNTESHLIDQPMNYQPKIAGFWIRFWAYTIDLIVLFSIGGLIIKPAFRILSIPVTNPSFIFFSQYKVVLLIVTLLYFLLMTKFLHQTVGKMILGIKVVAKTGQPLSWGTLVFREVIGRFISKILVIPYVLVAFMPQKEALHDLFADTYVVHEGVYEKGSRLNYLLEDKGEQLQEEPYV